MAFDAAAPNLTLGVVGTGSMGRGIMQVAAQGGMRVIAYDEKPGAVEAAIEFIGKMLERVVEKRQISPDEAQIARGRIAKGASLEEVAKADIIIEAILERLDAKQALFAKLDQLARPDTIIASNTSSIPITAIASACRHPERVGGMHFFNPVPLMRLVEIIPGLKTAPWVTEAMTAVGRRMTREPVLCTDSPAFLVNHVGRAFVPEGQRLLTEQIATPAEIDAILTGAPGFKQGPFALADMVGIDVQHGVMESVYALFYNEPAFTPFPVAAQRVAAGQLGQKTGAGWYTTPTADAWRHRQSRCRRRGRSRCGCARASTIPTCRRRSSTCSGSPAWTWRAARSRARTRSSWLRRSAGISPRPPSI